MFSNKNFLARFREYNKKHDLIPEGSRMVVAVSGGVDSMVLLDILARHTHQVSLVVAHINHMLRGQESDNDEQFVREAAADYGIPCRTERVDTMTSARTNRLGVQDAARRLRYQCLESIRDQTGSDRVATAHHANDSAETILFNLVRGTGAAGLTGIHPERSHQKVIRPMLFAERHEIEEYARVAEIAHRNDSSNDSDHYKRNLIRKNILPSVIDQINPAAIQNITRTGEILREIESFIDIKGRMALEASIVTQSEAEIVLSISELRKHHRAIQRHAVHLAGGFLMGNKLEFEHVASLLHLIDQQTGSCAELPSFFEALRDRDSLIIRRHAEATPFSVTVEPNREYRIGAWVFASEMRRRTPLLDLRESDDEYVNGDKLLGRTLVLRSWKDGDTFIPLGMKEPKKVSDYLTGAKVSRFAKHEVPILETSEGEVVWLCGHRIDERFKVTDGTEQVLRLEFSRTTEAE